MINCKDAVARLWSYLDRHPGRVDEEELEVHLGLCRHCCGELEFARRLRGLLRRTGTAAEIPLKTRVRLDALLKELEAGLEAGDERPQDPPYHADQR